MLMPFHPDFSDSIFKLSRGEEYRRAWRGINRWLTLEECSRLPFIIGEEVLIFSSDKFHGIVKLKENSEAVNFTIIIDKSQWGKGLGAKSLKELCDYCFNIKKTEMVTTECSVGDVASNKELEKQGFVKVGVLPYTNEDFNIWYKRR